MDPVIDGTHVPLNLRSVVGFTRIILFLLNRRSALVITSHLIYQFINSLPCLSAVPAQELIHLSILTPPPPPFIEIINICNYFPIDSVE